MKSCTQCPRKYMSSTQTIAKINKPQLFFLKQAAVTSTLVRMMVGVASCTLDKASAHGGAQPTNTALLFVQRSREVVIWFVCCQSAFGLSPMCAVLRWSSLSSSRPLGGRGCGSMVGSREDAREGKGGGRGQSTLGHLQQPALSNPPCDDPTAQCPASLLLRLLLLLLLPFTARPSSWRRRYLRGLGGGGA